MLITNQTDIAQFAYANGVERIFVDLEILGKKERQGHLNTVISCHTLKDVARIRRAVPEAQLLVRINPINPRSAQEVNAVIDAGADLLMLPMFQSVEEVCALTHIICERVPLVPLLETPAAVTVLEKIIEMPGISEIYIGLNDLSLAYKFKFMFQPLANGFLEKMASILRTKNMPFGFGGIAKLGEGKLPAEKVLSEHLRLGSSCVILSRAFHGAVNNLDDLNKQINFAEEIQKLRTLETQLKQRNHEQIQKDYRDLVDTIDDIIAAL